MRSGRIPHSRWSRIQRSGLQEGVSEPNIQRDNTYGGAPAEMETEMKRFGRRPWMLPLAAALLTVAIAWAAIVVS